MVTDTRQRTLLEARHKHDYSLFRYLYLIHIRGEIAAPDEVLLSLLFSGST